VLSEAEDLLKRAANETGDRAKDLRSQVEAKLLAAKLRLQEIEGEAVDRARDEALFEVGAFENLLHQAKPRLARGRVELGDQGHIVGPSAGNVGIGHLGRLSALRTRACSPPYW